VITLQCFLEIRPYKTTDVIRIQNYQIEDLIWDSKTWEFAGFTFNSYPVQQLELGNESAEILIANNEITASMLRQYDGLRRANVQAWHVRVGSSVPPLKWNLEVLSSTPDQGFISFTLRGPTSALVGPLVTKYFNSVEFPAVPVYSAQL
jgi:hypothetical protein